MHRRFVPPKSVPSQHELAYQASPKVGRRRKLTKLGTVFLVLFLILLSAMVVYSIALMNLFAHGIDQD
jgi:hypothetical protein